MIKGSTGNNGWLKSRAQISLVATDWTGVDYTKYKIDDETNWHTYTGSISVWTNGYHTVSYYSVDVYGNTEDVKTTPFKIDTEKPMLEVELSGTEVDGWYTTPVTVTCSANDDVSGLYIIRYSVDGGEWINYTGPFMIMEDGEHVLRCYAEDNAGNTKGKENPIQVRVDTGPPVTTCMLTGEGSDSRYYRNVTVTLDAEDAGSGVETIFYRLDNGEWMVYNDSFVVDEVGSHTLEFYSVDALGNEENVKTVVFTVSNINFNLVLSKPVDGLYLFNKRFLNLQKTVIIGAITVEAAAVPYQEGSEANVDYMEFFVDNVSKAVDNESPYSWIWDERVFGVHTVKVVAHADDDAVEVSKDVIVFNL